MSDWSVPKQEEALRSSATLDLPALALANNATRVLARVIERTPVEAGKTDRTPAEYRHHALWLLAIIGYRALRAAMAVFEAGYEEQAIGYTRLLGETWGRARKDYEDSSGTYAEQWVAGKPPGKGAKLTEQDIWDFFSHPQHADPRAVLDWIAISQPDGSTKVVLGPERRPDITNGGLTVMASEARDLAVLLANHQQVSISDLAVLDGALLEAHRRYGISDD